ncbi:MAG: hypothetical protein NZ899_13155 [Thermoguttaceae bacterium]|nr:hypothetical protein [Thermoguttaceae bacterium]MDW8079125.1 hypothetical protein [Thermoguttaceae bacterium]
MTAIGWHERNAQFLINHPRIEGTIDPARPGRGLTALAVDGTSLENWELLGVRWVAGREMESDTAPPAGFEDSAGRGGCVLRDCWFCGKDLLAEYVPQVGEDTSLTIRWRLLGGDSFYPDKLGIEVLFSLQTLHEPHYQRLCVTSLLGSALLYVITPGGAGVERFPVSESLCLPCRSWIVAAVGGTWSYQECVHPDDVLAAGVSITRESLPGSGSASEAQDGTLRGESRRYRTWYRLFAESVERGIIFRARVRAIFWPGNVSLEQGAKAYQDFVTGGPPLGD